MILPLNRNKGVSIMNLKLKTYGVCDVGLKKPNNEDLILLGDNIFRDSSRSHEFDLNNTVIIAIADGIGGFEKGEVASEIVLTRLREMLSKIPDDLTLDELIEVFEVYTQETHRSIIQGGSTLVGLLMYQDKVFRYHAGDSRIYLLRNGGLRRLTVDHSLKESGGNPNAPSNIITNSLGGGAKAFIDFAEIPQPLLVGDVYLLSSDGLHDLVPPDVISNILLTSELELGMPHADKLLELAKGAGGKDNISIVTIKIEAV